ncbi:hypothetical protein F5Y15DRAFT_428899 [Xylariaceae sp. FL0016]|nr:hypothetical protein F5Y15DRAFT_428899 [Xylariaceae sp. FL0016]
MFNPYFDPDYQPYTPSVLVGTALVFIILSISAVGLRFYARSRSFAYYGVDDWTCLPALAICLGLCVNQIISAIYGGLGSHQELVDGKLAHTSQLYVYEKTKWVAQVLGVIANALVKISVLFFFRRIFAVGTFRSVRLINNALIFLVAAWGITFTFVHAFQCVPASAAWELFEYEQTDCIQGFPYYFFGISDVVIDMIIFILPMHHLWRLKMPSSQKIAVACVFMVGSMVVAFGIAKNVVVYWQIEFAFSEPERYLTDVTWYSPGALFWHMTEEIVSLVLSCLPSLAPIFRGMVNKGSSSIAGTTGNTATHVRRMTYAAPYSHRIGEEIALNASCANTSIGTQERSLMSLPNDQIFVNKEIKVEMSSV